MAIKKGDKLPSTTLSRMGENGPEKVETDALFAGKTAVVFAVPGAFTPTCSARHLPGFVDHLDAIKAKDVDMVACLSVNDVFVMNAWGKSADARASRCWPMAMATLQKRWALKWMARALAWARAPSVMHDRQRRRGVRAVRGRAGRVRGV
ncbi:hypothetical protein JCM17843_16490 [Kordiimonadales bacterium JCM 17843]|nr:hypothetical protein JCM17843_16490 [Kordiimonadales bacterium JCM 17843]